MSRAGLRCVAAVTLALGLGACGYRTGLVMPEGRSQVGVRLFANDAPVPDLERDLHDSLTRALRDRTGAQLVRPSEAQAVIEGRILDYRRRGGIRTNRNVWQESAVILEVQALLVDPASGQVLARTRAQTPVGFTFDIDGGEGEAAQRALDNLAERLILELFVLAERRGPGAREAAAREVPAAQVPNSYP